MGRISPEAKDRSTTKVLSFDHLLELSHELQERGRRDISETRAGELVGDLVRSHVFRERFAPILNQVDIQITVGGKTRKVIRGSDIDWDNFGALEDEEVNSALRLQQDYLLHGITRDTFVEALGHGAVLVYIKSGQVEVEREEVDEIIREHMLPQLVYGIGAELSFESAPVLLFSSMKLVEHMVGDGQ